MSRHIDEVFARSLAQVTRLLRFDGAVLYAYVSDLHLLWPLKRHGHLPQRVPAVVPGAHLVGKALDSLSAEVVNEQEIALAVQPWLVARGAKTAVTVPLRKGPERFGVLLLWSERALEVDMQTLRAVSVFSSELTAAMRRSPLYIISDIQRHQIESVTRIITTASSRASDAEHFEIIARETRLLTGADTIAFLRPGKARVFTHLSRGNRPREDRRRTALRSQLPTFDLTFAISWSQAFHPTDQQSRLLELLTSALSAVEGLRARVSSAEREQRAQYLADVSKALSVSLELSVLFEQIQKFFVPAVADWVVVEVCASEDGDHDTIRTSATDLCPQRLRSAVHEAFTLKHETETNPTRRPLGFQNDGMVEIVIVPLIGRKRRIGAIGFGRSAARGYADAADHALYEELGLYATAAISNASIFGVERHIADVLQRALLPATLPADSRVQFDASYAPAESQTHVGGDWYDVFALGTDRFAVSIGDVAGHGMRAAATMNVVRLAFRTAALSEDDPSRVLERADGVLRLEEDPPMVTAIYGIVDLQRGSFLYACAGHLPPLLYSAGGNIQLLATRGLPLGVGLCDNPFLTFEHALAGGDTLVLYTDGLVEYGRDAAAGERHLHELLRGLHSPGSATSLARTLHAATFGNGARQNDDVAVLSISLLPAKRPTHGEIAAPESSAALRGL